MTIESQVLAALDAATHQNGYPHEYNRAPSDIALEIHDWSGIEGFDCENPTHLGAAVAAVNAWRAKNPLESA